MQKRDDFRYANGPAYCISEALMMKVEKYLRYVIICESGEHYIYIHEIVREI